MTQEEHNIRKKVADEIKQRFMPLCPFCDHCDTQVMSWRIKDTLEVVLQRHVTVEELMPHARSTH